MLRQYNPWEPEFDFTPPARRPGEVTGPPDFVGIGVQKAGTSWWFDLITAHPDAAELIAGPDNPVQKERHFFTRYATEAFGDGEIACYHGWFPHLAGKLCGEWTPDYLYYPWVPALLAKAAPDAKLLVILRDPVERFRSGLTHELELGAVGIGNTVTAAIDHGFYAAQLRRWLDHFDRKQILVLQYERCAADPAGQLAATFRFLGLAPYEPPGLSRPVHATVGRKVPLDDDVVQRLVHIYREDVADLCGLVPDIDRALWRHFAGDLEGASGA